MPFHIWKANKQYIQKLGCGCFCVIYKQIWTSNYSSFSICIISIENFQNKQITNIGIMQGPIISSKQISLISNYFIFDMLPFKKYQECNVRIPQTVLLEKGFIKEWIFNSHKIPNHPILKKKRENMTPLIVVKMFCQKFGYGNVTHSCITIQDIRDEVKAVLRQQKDYDFAKDKKVIEVTTITDEVLSMSLSDFLDFVSQNKFAQQQFYEKWKMIQEKCSAAKIDEFYEVENVRHNHLIESKCKKIISLNTTQAQIISTELEDDPYKKSSPSRDFSISETKNVEGYKFFDTFLNKKFFQMSQQLIDFIEKNFKCLVQSIMTKFVINKDRQPYLIGGFDLHIKPAKKISEMKDYQISKQKGFIKLEEYMKHLQVYISQNMEKYENLDLSAPINERKKKCKGKFCKLYLQDAELPPLLQQKLKLPSMSANTRLITTQMRDAVISRKRRVLQKFTEHSLIDPADEIVDQSSEYETSNEQHENVHVKQKNRQLKVCQNCFVFYFHVNRFYELDMYGNLVEKKTPLAVGSSEKKILSQDTLPPINFKKPNLTSPTKNQSHKEQETQAKNSFQIKPVTVQSTTNKNLSRSKSNTKMGSYSKQKPNKNLKSQRNITPSSLSKIKLDPLLAKKHITTQESNEKANRLANITKLSQPVKLKQRNKPVKQQQMLPLKERRPENHLQAIQQLIRKFHTLPRQDRDEFIYAAKKYFKDNLIQPIDRRSYSNYYYPQLYEFMNNSTIIVHPKQRIKKRPEMSLKRLSELTEYPQIVSRSQFIFDTLIVNEQTTIPFCIITTDVVNPDNLRSGSPYENIIIINDIFDSFIEHISMAKQILEEDGVYNKRIILFNYPGQSHTIYNQTKIHPYSLYFTEIIDKILFRLSGHKGELKIIDLEQDLFKFFGFGYGGYLLSTYIGHSFHYFKNISGIMLINSYMRMPQKYRQNLESLLTLYESNDPTAQSEAFLYYNKSINSEEVNSQDLEHKAGLNPIRNQDRAYLLKSALKEINASETAINLIQPLEFQQFQQCQVSIIHCKKNVVVPRQSSQQYLTYRKNKKQLIPGRIFIELDGGHDILADNYEDITRVMTVFCKR